ncbi:MAG: hypothetical protein QG622_1709 [Actinomycetota bacterium]|nr:hypothetical protein [Actinomycetota bacterium]
MRPTGDGARPRPAPAGWQAPLEADPADAREQVRDVVDGSDDPEAPVTGSPSDLDLDRASEADLAEQSVEVPIDDDGER